MGGGDREKEKEKVGKEKIPKINNFTSVYFSSFCPNQVLNPESDRTDGHQGMSDQLSTLKHVDRPHLGD